MGLDYRESKNLPEFCDSEEDRYWIYLKLEVE